MLLRQSEAWIVGLNDILFTLEASQPTMCATSATSKYHSIFTLFRYCQLKTMAWIADIQKYGRSCLDCMDYPPPLSTPHQTQHLILTPFLQELMQSSYQEATALQNHPTIEDTRSAAASYQNSTI